MLKKISCLRFFYVLFFVFFFILALPEQGLATSGGNSSVFINEIMYDLDGADIDWIEVYNSGSAAVDLSLLRLLVSNSVSNHAIRPYSSDSAILSSGEYAIVVDNSQISAFIKKWGNIKNIFVASFSLPNVSGDQIATIELNAGDKNAPINSVTYEALLGAKGDGNSLQLLEGVWKGSVPTPGAENVFISGSSSSDSSGSGAGGGSLGPGAGNAAEPKIQAKILAPNRVFAGESAPFRAAILEDANPVVHYGKYYWNFGDGSSLEENGSPEKILHLYSYPGDYAVQLEYFQSGIVSGEPDYSARMELKSVPMEISIKPMEEAETRAVALTNQSAYEIDISGWRLFSGQKVFIFPRGTMLLSKKTIAVSPAVTSFLPEDKNLKLLSNTGKVVAEHSETLAK